MDFIIWTLLATMLAVLVGAAIVSFTIPFED